MTPALTLTLSPGRGNRCRSHPTFQTASRQTPASEIPISGGKFSLSPGERAGVRAVVSFVGIGNRIAVKLPNRLPHIFWPAANVTNAFGVPCDHYSE